MAPRSRQARPYLIGVLAFAAVAHLGLGSQAFGQVGLSDWQASLILLAMVAFRSITLPIYEMRGGRGRLQRLPAAVQRALLRLRSQFVEETTVSLSVGGVLIPLGASVYVMAQSASLALDVINASFVVVAIVELIRLALLRAHVLRPVGKLVPMVALALGWMLPSEHWSAVVYVSGFVAALVTIDLPALNDLQTIGTHKVVIGGDASFGTVFLSCGLSLLFT